MFLEKLKSVPKNKFLLTTTIIGFLIFILINLLIFAQLTVLVSIYNILDFEFAWTADKVQVIFTTWGPSGMLLQALGVYWDFLYIIGYASFIFGCILLISRQLAGTIQKIGIYLTLTPLLAGIFDVIENINLLIMLNNPASFNSGIPFITSIIALIKFGVLFLGIIFFFIALIIVIIKLIKNRKK